jgi:3-oxoacyl-[acyl-carrier protein] reductase
MASEWSFQQKLNQVLAVDVVATMMLSRRVGQLMQSHNKRNDHCKSGLIINMGWDQAEQGMAGDSGQMFAAAKGAVMAATRSLAQSLAPHIRVNCVAPGWIQTSWGQTASNAWQNRAAGDSLMERWGQPSDVAGVVSFLAGPDGQFVNGQVIPVNGGFRYGSPSNPLPTN